MKTELNKPSSKTADAILIHVGYNDIKTTDTTIASKNLCQAIQNFSKDNPRIRLIISKITPVADAKLDTMKDLFNAVMMVELQDLKTVSFVSHDHLRPDKKMMKDGVHPSTRGSSVLAAEIGRHVNSLFWKRQSRPSRRPPRPVNLYPFRDVYTSNPYHILSDWFY